MQHMKNKSLRNLLLNSTNVKWLLGKWPKNGKRGATWPNRSYEARIYASNDKDKIEEDVSKFVNANWKWRPVTSVENAIEFLSLFKTYWHELTKFIIGDVEKIHKVMMAIRSMRRRLSNQRAVKVKLLHYQTLGVYQSITILFTFLFICN